MGGYVGTMLGRIPGRGPVGTTSNIQGNFSISKRDADAMAIDYGNGVREQAKQEIRQVPKIQTSSSTVSSNEPKKTKVPQQLNINSEAIAKQNQLKTKQTDYATYNTSGHSKANGLNMAIEYPEKWTAKEGKRPYIVQVFDDGKLSACMIQSRPVGSIFSTKRWEREFNLYSKEDMKAFGDVLFVLHTKYDGEPGVLVEGSMNKQRAGMDLHMHYLAHMFGHKGNLVMVSCASYGTTQEMADNLFKQDVFDFFQIGNSIVLYDKWKTGSTEKDTGSFIDKLSDLLYGTAEQSSMDYDSGKSIYKQQFLDKMTDALSRANQPEVIQAAEVDGVRYSIAKSDKSFVVQTAAEIPDAYITAFMDVFTKMVDMEKLKKFYEINNIKILEQAAGAYNFIEGNDMRIIQWCEPYYSLKVLPGKMRAKLASRQQYAATLLKEAWGDNWKVIISKIQERLAPKIMQAAEHDYQVAKSLAAEYNEKLSKVEYCKRLDDDSDYLVSYNVKLFKQLYPDIDNGSNLGKKTQPVVYNHVSQIYHKPDCEWVQKCANNCLKTQKGAAIMDGGRPCHVCNP